MQCPADKGLENYFANNQPRCVYKADRSKAVNLNVIEAVPYNWMQAPPPPPTLAGLQTSNPGLYTKYKTELDRATGEINVLLANIDKQKRIDDAFKALQTAENARDTAPLAYNQARSAYYTLLRGDSWKTEEQERLAKAEVDPEIQQFRKNLADVQNRKSQQQKTIDVVNGLRDKVLSLKDDFKYSTNVLQDQLGKIKDQIVFDRRKREEQSNEGIWDLLDKGLNYAIVGVLLLAIWKLYGMYSASSTSSESSSGSTPPATTKPAGN